jgi:hypothetical protein
LGGALTLRAEIEAIARQKSISRIELSIGPADYLDSKVQSVINEVFLRSRLDFHIINEFKNNGYPFISQTKVEESSYYSTLRLQAMFREDGIRPNLSWNAEVEKEASNLATRIGHPFIILHVRNEIGLSSNWNGDTSLWAQIVEYLIEKKQLSVVAIGADPIPDRLRINPKVVHVASQNIPLSTQLALVQKSKGFTGTASGMASPAMFSAIPYLIFKNPRHHVKEMLQELGMEESLNFATDKQKLLRIEESFELMKVHLDEFSRWCMS